MQTRIGHVREDAHFCLRQGVGDGRKRPPLRLCFANSLFYMCAKPRTSAACAAGGGGDAERVFLRSKNTGGAVDAVAPEDPVFVERNLGEAEQKAAQKP